MKKIYRKLTKDQKNRGIIFSSCLKGAKDERINNTIHEVHKCNPERDNIINNLKNDKFFNDSPWSYNEIRK